MTARAPPSQCGAPSPTNAGTKYTPPVSGVDMASASLSAAEVMKPIWSRSHFTAAPAMNTLPSTANCAEVSNDAARVASSRCWETGRTPPVCSSAKQPVPYVFFDSPGRKHAWPTSAACWSPRDAGNGDRRPQMLGSASPTTLELGTMRGSIVARNVEQPSMSSSQSPVARFISIVRDALEKSVTCVRPLVSRQISHVSTLPNSSSPSTRASARPSRGPGSSGSCWPRSTRPPPGRSCG